MKDQGATNKRSGQFITANAPEHPLLPTKPGEYWDGVSGIRHVKPRLPAEQLHEEAGAAEHVDHVVGFTCEPIN